MSSGRLVPILLKNSLKPENYLGGLKFLAPSVYILEKLDLYSVLLIFWKCSTKFYPIYNNTKIFSNVHARFKCIALNILILVS